MCGNILENQKTTCVVPKGGANLTLKIGNSLQIYHMCARGELGVKQLPDLGAAPHAPLS
jgi:hypothetical protein